MEVEKLIYLSESISVVVQHFTMSKLPDQKIQNSRSGFRPILGWRHFLEHDSMKKIPTRSKELEFHESTIRQIFPIEPYLYHPLIWIYSISHLDIAGNISIVSLNGHLLSFVPFVETMRMWCVREMPSSNRFEMDSLRGICSTIGIQRFLKKLSSIISIEWSG